MTEWIMDSVLVTTALLALVLVIRKPVSRIFGATIAYGLWLLPAARVLMPSLEREVVADPTHSATNANDIVYTALVDGPVYAPMQALSGIAEPSINWLQLVITLWLGVAALIFVVQMLRYLAMREALLSEARDLGRVSGVRLIESDQVSGPLAFGLFQRFIAVPQNFNSIFPPAERELALAHEMAHHRSGDLFANLTAFTLLCLTWFNPLSWLAWRAFRFDQEAACDARVLLGRDDDARQIYGRALARAAHDGIPAFATALNNRSTLIARLRGLTMKDISKSRRTCGRVAILAAIGTIIPLTATTIPVWAHDESLSKSVTSVRHHGEDTTTINIAGDSKMPYVITVVRNGKTVVLRTRKKLSDVEINKLADEAEASRAAADAAVTADDAARADADDAIAAADSASAANDAAMANADRAKADADHARANADKAWSEAEDSRRERTKSISNRTDSKVHAATSSSMAWNFATSMIPEVEISEATGECIEGQPVTTNIRGFDGGSHPSVHLVICGKAIAKHARLAALEGLREACDEINDDEDMPESVRRKVVRKLEAQIRQMEREQRSES